MSTPEEDPVLKVTGAAKAFGRQPALAGLDLAVNRGQWTGLVGPNGAGKTTLMLAIAGLVPLDAGRIRVLGQRIEGPRPTVIGWVPQSLALYPQLTARENLRAFGRLHGVASKVLKDRIRWALDWIGLEDRMDHRVATFSGGMQRRLNIACAVLHRPRLLLLDEPTVGVDPQARLRIFNMLEALREDGVALLQSSHALGDVEHTCDTLAVMDRGRCIAAGGLRHLVRSHVGDRARLTLELDLAATSLPGLERQPDGRWTAELDDAAAELPPLLDAVRRAEGRLTGLDLRRPDLREVLLELTGRELRE